MSPIDKQRDEVTGKDRTDRGTRIGQPRDILQGIFDVELIDDARSLRDGKHSPTPGSAVHPYRYEGVLKNLSRQRPTFGQTCAVH